MLTGFCNLKSGPEPAKANFWSVTPMGHVILIAGCLSDAADDELNDGGGRVAMQKVHHSAGKIGRLSGAHQ